mgnify:CR=1 FL=1
MKAFNEYSEVELIELMNQMHNEDKVSIREIARRLNTYPVKLLRFCKRYGIPVLTKQESLLAAYESGRVIPQALGKTKTEAEKIKIGDSQHKYWASLSQKEKNVRSQQQSEIFSKRKDKDEFSRKGCQAIRKAADEGSKLEKALIKFFDKTNIAYYHHYAGLLPTTKLEIDFFLPGLNVVIEVDGPSHFSANFGIENYAGQLDADQRKNGLVLGLGASIIRVQHNRTLYPRDHRNVCHWLNQTLPLLNNELKVINVDDI